MNMLSQSPRKTITKIRVRSLVHKDQRGVIIIGAFIITLFFLSVSIAVAEFSVAHYTSARRSLQGLSALSVAEAGADETMLKLNQVSTYSGTGGDIVFFNDSVKGKGVYNTTVAPGTLNNEKIVVTTGKIYLPASAAQPIATRKIRLVLRGAEPFVYAVQGGNSGPIYMYGNTGINAPAKIFSNKYIRIQDASVSASGTFQVADKDPTAAYSSFNCSIDGNNHILNSTINVRYNINNANCGIDTAGDTVTQNDSSIGPQSLPTVDKAGILSTIAANASCASINNTDYHLKNANYPQQTGGTLCDVTLDKNKTYTLDGNVYIRGNLTVDGDTIQADSSLTSDVYVLVDGTINFQGNSTSISTNVNNVAITFVSYSSVDSAGSKIAPNAIDIRGNSLSLLGRFLALNGSLGFKGRGTLGPVGANSIVFDGSGAVTFSNINSIPASPTGWDVKYYEQIYQ